ncbi:hypothetical protein F503_00038 [Ophiostoma piceae UAMH 11346]|uniref:Uncharacterized protein n=1 Tax=Ophiostoma piceae (strain UAMH 11346) TaxID=1262450 RepID=S3BUE8_OPHP1|nr:hypothetical protein F503_00038 [Ophiostoma piceae UAMH 11346]
MCFGATCSTCSKKSWRGCGRHIPQALAGVSDADLCSCEPRVTVDGKDYPPMAAVSIPGASFISSLFGWGGASKQQAEQAKKGEL